MIQNRTARKLMYDWHSGQFSAFYAAASSGLCASFAALVLECDSVTDQKEKQDLLNWIQRKSSNYKEVLIRGKWYAILPWIGRDYIIDGTR